jgi:orotate phosphoribosyltransferase
VLDFSNVSKISASRENISRLVNLTNAISYLKKGAIEICNGRNCLKKINENFEASISVDIDVKLKNYWNDTLEKQTDIVKFIHSYVFMDFLLRDIEENNHKYNDDNLKYLESSNVYVNRYINIKAFFLNPDYLRLLVNDMAEKIRLEFKEDYNKFCLLGVSNNGIILSHLIAYQLGMDVKCINHIGPKYCLFSGNEALNDLKNEKFILISDVVCLGGEYRMAKGIVEVFGANLIGAVTVVKIRDVYRNGDEKANDRIVSIIDNPNQYIIDGKRLNYKIYIDRRAEKDVVLQC